MSQLAHRMSGIPGAYCLDCGNEFAIESALACPDCDLKAGPDDDATDTLCPLHQLWVEAMRTCPPDPELVRRVNLILKPGASP